MENQTIVGYIPVYQPELSGNEKTYVMECLDTSWISSRGRFIPEFESKFCQAVGSHFAASVSNGSVALHLALLALDIGPGDEVIVPSFTYVASVNAIRYVGATPVFVDIEPQSWQMDCTGIEDKISENTKAIMAVHIYGHPCDMYSAKRIAEKHGLYLIEDCAEAFGSKIDGIHVGNFSDIATYSFFGNKTITTGEGGMVVSKNGELDRRIRHLKGQGLMDGREYWHDIVGYNYRMTNICAAIGLAQLENAGSFLKRKQDIAIYYTKNLNDLPIDFQFVSHGIEHSWWMFSILTKNVIQRDALRRYLQAEGIETRPLFNPVHMMPMYSQDNFTLAVTESIYCRGINLPSWPGLSDQQLSQIVSSIRKFYAGN